MNWWRVAWSNRRSAGLVGQPTFTPSKMHLAGGPDAERTLCGVRIPELYVRWGAEAEAMGEPCKLCARRT